MSKSEVPTPPLVDCTRKGKYYWYNRHETTPSLSGKHAQDSMASQRGLVAAVTSAGEGERERERERERSRMKITGRRPLDTSR